MGIISFLMNTKLWIGLIIGYILGRNFKDNIENKFKRFFEKEKVK